jgi:hypothetical protein
MSISKIIFPSLLWLSMKLLAQIGRVEGYVIDSDGKGIRNAVVSFEHPGFHSRNDANAISDQW